MLMSPVEPRLSPFAHHVVRLLRRWSAHDPLDGSRIASLVRLAGRLGVPTEAAVALASTFELTEACLGRPLQGECCCSPNLSRDERAVLTMLAAAMPTLPHRASREIPHGLPGALLWAVASVQRLLGETAVPAPRFRARECPFARNE